VNAAFCPDSSGPFKVAVTVAPPALLGEYLELTARVTPSTSRARIGAAEGTKASLNTTVRACENVTGREPEVKLQEFPDDSRSVNGEVSNNPRESSLISLGRTSLLIRQVIGRPSDSCR
jgi:hypothetical protein